MLPTRKNTYKYWSGSMPDLRIVKGGAKVPGREHLALAYLVCFLNVKPLACVVRNATALSLWDFDLFTFFTDLRVGFTASSITAVTAYRRPAAGTRGSRARP